MDGESGIVRLNYCVGYFGGGNNAESVHDPIGILLSDLGDEEGPHARASATAEGVGQLESLQAIAALSLFTDAIKNRVNQLSSLSVVALCPVVTSSTLTCDSNECTISTEGEYMAP